MTENTRVCPFCGAKNSSDVKFCGYCGGPMQPATYTPPTAALPDDPVPTPPSFDPPRPPADFEQAPLPPVTPPRAASTGAPIPPPPYGAPPPPPAPRRNNFLIPGIIIVLVLCVVCFCLSMVLGAGLLRNRTRSALPQAFPMPVQITPPAVVIPDLKITPEVRITVVSGEEIQATAEALATQIIEGLGTLTVPQLSTPVPTDEGSASGMKTFADDHVTLVYDRSLATGIQAETIPEQKGADQPYWDTHPAYQQYTLEGYPLQGTFHKPQVFIYPIADYVKLLPDVQQRVDALKSVLKNKPADLKAGDALPFLPFWNAAPVLVAQPKYYPNGVRFITQFAQAVNPVTNQELFYTYQGLSSDGKYYIAAILPVSTALLPDTANLSGAEYDQFVKDYEKYLADLITKLNNEQPAGFTPDLSLLDDFVQSILVQ